MIFSFQAKEGSSTLGSPFNKLPLSDIPGDPGSQLPNQESPPLLPGSYLIGISHFPIQADWGLGSSCLSVVF